MIHIVQAALRQSHAYQRMPRDKPNLSEIKISENGANANSKNFASVRSDFEKPAILAPAVFRLII